MKSYIDLYFFWCRTDVTSLQCSPVLQDIETRSHYTTVLTISGIAICNVILMYCDTTSILCCTDCDTIIAKYCHCIQPTDVHCVCLTHDPTSNSQDSAQRTVSHIYQALNACQNKCSGQDGQHPAPVRWGAVAGGRGRQTRRRTGSNDSWL